MKRLFIAVFTAALLVNGALSFAQKGPAQGRKQRPGRVQVQGSGQISASGKGTAQLIGSGAIEVKGSGQVYIVAPKLSIKADGFGFQRSEGKKHFYEGKGTFRVKGRGVEVSITGEVDSFKCKGKGKARLKGEGSFSTKNRKGSWTTFGEEVNF